MIMKLQIDLLLFIHLNILFLCTGNFNKSISAIARNLTPSFFLFNILLGILM